MALTRGHSDCLGLHVDGSVLAAPYAMKARHRIAGLALAFILCGCAGSSATEAIGDAAIASGDIADISAMTAFDSFADGGWDANCFIVTAGSDPSCAVDTDCVVVSPGNYCYVHECRCDGTPVNKRAAALLSGQLAGTPIGSGAVAGADCGCPSFHPFGFPCCRAGKCTWDCLAASDTLPMCQDAGGACTLALPQGVTPCPQCNGCDGGGTGPSNSCTYADEVCCLPCRC